MPKHDYQCNKKTCNHVWEVSYATHSERDETEKHQACPKCGSKKKEKLISTGTSFKLNGSGWYKGGYSK